LILKQLIRLINMPNFIYHPLLRPISKLLVIFIIIFTFIQPYNWFCKASNKCEGFYFLDLFEYLPNFSPKIEANIVLEIYNQKNVVKIEAVEPVATRIINGSTHKFTYVATNNLNEEVDFKMDLVIAPKELEQFITKKYCPCSTRQKLKPKEQRTFSTKLKIDNNIIGHPSFKADEGLKIIYLVS